MMDISQTNSTSIICRNEHLVAVNAVVKIDFFGQFCVDFVCGRLFSGISEQSDFIRGESVSYKGKFFIDMSLHYK